MSLTYFGLISIAIKFLPCFFATSGVVPAPPKGSRTISGIACASWHSHVGCQPTVFCSFTYSCPCSLAACLNLASRPEVDLSSYMVLVSPVCFVSEIFSITRTQGLPHLSHCPHSEVPAFIQSTIKSSGIVAKCAALKGFVATCHTDFLLAVIPSHGTDPF